MLKNYIKIAIAVMKRRKFFTFISLFGISFTLTIIILLSAMIDHLISPAYPDTNRDRALYVIDIKMTSKEGYLYKGGMSLYYYEQYLSRLKPRAKIALASEPRVTNTYINNKKIAVQVKYTNDEFWEVFNYDFIEGKPYTKDHISRGDKVIVISAATQKSYFGNEQQVVGKYIETDNVRYRVIGVVKTVPLTLRYNFGDAYLPYSEAKDNLLGKSYDGIFLATLLASNKADLPGLRQEYQHIVSRIPMKGTGFDEITSNADSYLVLFTRQSVQTAGNSKDTGVLKTLSIGLLIFFLFLLLPTLNLVNINISRISERSSEIGVRKAFGASARTLVFQFIVENVILTFIGGLIGLVLAVILIQVFNSSNVIDSLHLTVNYKVLLYSFAACLFFGLLSGVYPAWRMSKLHVVTALKSK